MLESGSCDVFVTRPGDITAKKVKSYGAGSAFGELALLYAAPRAATVSTNITIVTAVEQRNISCHVCCSLWWLPSDIQKPQTNQVFCWLPKQALSM